MKSFSLFLSLIGFGLAFLGILPFIFDFPYSDGPNSGPQNIWELILMIGYDLKGWGLFLGIVVVLCSFYLYKYSNSHR